VTEVELITNGPGLLLEGFSLEELFLLSLELLLDMIDPFGNSVQF